MPVLLGLLIALKTYCCRMGTFFHMETKLA
jgi:hypothetical protein